MVNVLRDSEQPMGLDGKTEIYTNIQVDLDSNGDGTAGVNFDSQYRSVGEYIALPVIKGRDGQVAIDNKFKSSVDIKISNSSYTNYVTCDLFVVGLR